MKHIVEYLLSKNKKLTYNINNDDYVIAVVVNANFSKLSAKYGDWLIGDKKKNFPWLVLDRKSAKKFYDSHTCVLCKVPKDCKTLDELRQAYFDGKIQLEQE